MSDMKNRKVSASKRRARQRKQRNRRIAMTLCLMLVVCVASIGGTLAWLTSTTAPVVNTFTPSDINITLTETKSNFKMVPGTTIDKDPVVTVEANSEACWLFVKVEESTNLSQYIEYSVITGEDGWTALTGVNGVYYREVAASTDDQSFRILTNDKVTVKEGVTKSMMETLKATTSPLPEQPTLTFTAYAVQKDNVLTVADAWAKANPTT